MRIERKHLVRIGVAAAVVLLIALMMRPERIPVEVTVADEGPLLVTIDEDGLTRVRRHAEITAPVTGRVAEAPVRAGDSVRAGTVVARLTPAPLDTRARAEAQAAVQAAAALRAEAETRVEQARIAVEEARRARSRAERLAGSGGIATRELELAQDAERLRDRDLSAATSRLRAAEQDERRARSVLVGSDPATSGGAPVLLRSPMTGRVLRLLEEHDRVVPAGTTLLEVGDPASMEVVVDVLSREVGAVRPGARMLVMVPGNEEVEARVERVEPAAFTRLSPLGVEEQRVNVIGRFVQPPIGMGDGFEVDVRIVLSEQERVLAVPATALVPVDTGWGVFAVQGGRARLRPVQLGDRGARMVGIRAGIGAGDTVIVHPGDRVRDGVRVTAAPRG